MGSLLLPQITLCIKNQQRESQCEASNSNHLLDLRRRLSDATKKPKVKSLLRPDLLVPFSRGGGNSHLLRKDKKLFFPYRLGKVYFESHERTDDGDGMMMSSPFYKLIISYTSLVTSDRDQKYNAMYKCTDT